MNYMVGQRLLTLVVAAIAAGCAFSKLDRDLAKMQDVTHVFAGMVYAEDIEVDALFVVALRDRAGEKIADFRVLASPGPFAIKSDPTPIYLFAFDDLNQDFRFQATEPYGWAAAGKPLDPSTQATDDISITVNTTVGGAAGMPEQLIDEPLESHINDRMRFHAGTVTSLDNPWFSKQQARKGLWQPFAFIQDGGAGLHFLEPYDPDRIPVLFVHGTNGTPQNFQAVIGGLDRSRFQAWVFSYPSGLRIPVLANGMLQLLELTHRKYRFESLHVVAHSMGGLVSRGTLNLCSERDTCDYLRSYITISTPWNGVASAQRGVDRAPTVVPVWRDLAPDSDYIGTLFDTPLPPGLPHYLLFGFRQSSIFGRTSSDGVIKLNSQLRNVAQEQAQLVRGYDEGHVSILSSEIVTGKVYEILFETKQ